MKHFPVRTLLLAAAVVSVLSSCLRVGSSGAGHWAVQTDSVAERDSLGERSILLRLPKAPASNVQRLLCEWVSESLGGTYTGSLSDPKAMLRFYLQEKGADFKDNYIEMDSLLAPRMEYISDAKIEPLAETSKYLTMCYTGFEFWGGAHGSNLFIGQTFRKADGRRIGWEVFSPNLNDLLRGGLKQYFEVGSDADLMDHLLGVENIYLIPLPECPPLFKEDGVMFVYQNYEIAPYAAGQPSFTISYEALAPYMNQTARQLVE